MIRYASFTVSIHGLNEPKFSAIINRLKKIIQDEFHLRMESDLEIELIESAGSEETHKYQCCFLINNNQGRCESPADYFIGQNFQNNHTYSCETHLDQMKSPGDTVLPILAKPIIKENDHASKSKED